MGIRRCLTLLCALSLGAFGLGAGQPAVAGEPTDFLYVPFDAAGTIFNDSPPTRIQNFRFYRDGDNFSISPVTSFSESVRKRIDPNGVLGIKVLPAYTSFTLNGEPSDFAGAVIEGCTTEVEGIVVQLYTGLGKDQAYAQTVATTCP